MLIMSWNVAGLSQTVKRIDKNYGNDTLRKQSPSSVLKAYLERHGADIFCVQESKIPLAQLESRSEPLQCAHIRGYESFWSCCVDAKKRGFNGVTTYCRQGLVQAADSKPLGSPDLDDQGRCVMTDHGSFVIFNVYVPAGGGSPLRYKMKFLNALRRAMKKQREQHGKHVILVGDLNISHTENDVFWGSLRLDIDKLCGQVRDAAVRNGTQTSESPASLPKWQVQLANAWPKIQEILKSKKVVQVQTTNPRTKEKFDKYRLAVMKDDKEIFLGGYEESPSHCEHYFDFEPAYYQCDDSRDLILAEEGNLIDIATVAELMTKLGGIEWDVELQRKIADSHGQRSKAHPPRLWLNQILNDDGMVDTMRHFYPDAKARFTIWDQFRNRRYENQGARIDFTIVDRALLLLVQKGADALRCACQGRHDRNSEEAALCAATAGGRFQAVSFDGGGIIEATQAALDTQFGDKHTGIIYVSKQCLRSQRLPLLLT